MLVALADLLASGVLVTVSVIVISSVFVFVMVGTSTSVSVLVVVTMAVMVSGTGVILKRMLACSMSLATAAGSLTLSKLSPFR